MHTTPHRILMIAAIKGTAVGAVVITYTQKGLTIKQTVLIYYTNMLQVVKVAKFVYIVYSDVDGDAMKNN